MREGGRVVYPDSLPGPISFPVELAEDAVADCRRVVALLEEDGPEWARLAGVARDGWEGKHRENFDEVFDAQDADLANCEARLLTLASQIEAALEHVDVENKRREEHREDYRALVTREGASEEVVN